MPWHILQRYIFGELLRVFAMAQIAISGLFVMAFIVSEAAMHGCGPGQVLALVPLMIPSTLPYTVPATTLFAIVCVYGRLSQDNEITALKSAGVPVRTILWPALWIGAALSIAMFFLSVGLIPMTLHKMRTIIRSNIEDIIYSMLKKNLSYSQMGVNYGIWVQEVQGRRLIRPTFIRRDDKGRDETIAQAREAEIEVDVEAGLIHIHMTHSDISKDGGVTSAIVDERQTFSVAIPEALARSDKKARNRELTNRQLQDRRAEWVSTGETVRLRRAELLKDPDPNLIQRELPQFDWQVDANARDIASLDSEIAMRRALALGCICFVLIGCPIGIWFHKGDYLSAFVTCFLPIILTYYPLILFGANLCRNGRFDPMIVLLSADALLAVVGAVLYFRLARR